MSSTELERLLAEEAALRAKLEELVEKRRIAEAEEEKRRIEREKSDALKKLITIRVAGILGENLLLQSDYRWDIVEIYKATPGRRYRGYNENLIPMTQWADLEPKLLARPNVVIEWSEKAKAQYDWYTSAPSWDVSLSPNGRYILAKWGPRTDRYILSSIPGARQNHENGEWEIPLSEAWRLWDILSGIEGVTVTDEAAEQITALIKARIKLDAIAKKDDSDIEIPYADPSATPRPFQKVGVEFIEAANGRALIGDEMGLGKTWQALGYAQRLRRQILETENRTARILIICKGGLKANWLRETKRLCGTGAYLCFGREPNTYDIQNIITNSPEFVICNYEILGSATKLTEHDENGKEKVTKTFRWALILKLYNPDLIIIDESHYIKNPDTNRAKAVMSLDAPRIVALTGTPVLNRPGEFWTTLHMLAPKTFPHYETFLRQYVSFDGRSARNVDELVELLKPMMIRRRKSDVLKDLPPINRIRHFHELSPRARKLYDLVLAGLWEQIEEYDALGQHGGTKRITSILAKIMRMKQICAIDKVQTTADLATDLIDSASNGGKVLIFTQFKASAARIAQLLGNQAVSTVKRRPSGFISMTPGERDQLFESVRHDPHIRFIVTTEAAREGHNMEYCDWVIFNDLFWTPAGHSQCEGRAYGRLANPHPIDSYYILTEETIEEWIMELLARKLAMFEQVVDGVENARDADVSVAMELIERLRQEFWKKEK